MSDLKKYEYVIAVEESGGISQAAETLNIAQPTLSKYLKKLENELGIELFDRSTIPIRTTEAGSRYIETGRKMIDLDRQLQKQLCELKVSRNTVIRVGISPSRSPYLMPAVVEAFKQKNPQGRITIEERTTAELNQRLARGDLDLIISLLDEDAANFERVELFDENILVAVAKNSGCSFNCVLEALREEPFINVGSGQTMWKIANEIIKNVGADKPDIECQSIESALALVKRGLGVMIVPSYIAQYGSEEQKNQLEFLELPTEAYQKQPTTFKRKVCLFYRKSQVLSQAEKDFIFCVKEKVLAENQK